jgi:tetratricopeptide (TPR) repeat protein
MNIAQVLQGLDELFAQARVTEIEPYLVDAYEQAAKEGDYGSMLSIVNELIGYCREVCHYEQMVAYGEDALRIIEQTGLTDSIPHATTLLNIANGLRAGGYLEQSQTTYGQVEELYQKLLPEGDFGFADLYNNRSLLYQNLGDYKEAAKLQEQALMIAQRYPDRAWEVATTNANLATTYTELSRQNPETVKYLELAKQAAYAAICGYFKLQVRDTHYAAAVSALGKLYEQSGEYGKAVACFQEAADAIRTTLGETDFYHMVLEYETEAEKKRIEAGQTIDEGAFLVGIHGMELCREYFQTCGYPMLQEKYGDYLDRMTIGLVGEGSDCFGFDDEYSRDHDWGPGFCIWLEDDIYEQIGEQLQSDYDVLPTSWRGYQRITTGQGSKRLGVHKVSEWMIHFLGMSAYQEWKQTGVIQPSTMMNIESYQLAAICNGEIFYTKGTSTLLQLREFCNQYYDDSSIFLMLAEHVARYSQCAQYNYTRMLQRGDRVSASILLHEGVKEAMKIGYLCNRVYAPHEKWLYEGTKTFTRMPKLAEYTENIINSLYEERESGNSVKEQSEKEFLNSKEEGTVEGRITEKKTTEEWVEELSTYILEALLECGYIGDAVLMTAPGTEENGEPIYYLDNYLEHYSRELILRSQYQKMKHEELVEYIAKMEFQAFDQVVNEGGRAGCQDDWYTFHIMRSSQYTTWTDDMLIQYATDFQLAMDRGWNMIMEKYGRMEESTTPEAWNRIKREFPVIPEGKRMIIEQIIQIQVRWMEEFASQYPGMASNARRIHTSEDMPWDTSYETYLRGEMSTYSDRMLKLYGQFIVGLVQENKNLAYMIMEETVRQYGYQDLEDAAGKLTNS